MELFNLLGQKSFKDVVNTFTKAPYFFKIQENEKTYMLSFTEDSDMSSKEVRQANGVIFEKETNKVLHYSFEKFHESLEDCKDFDNSSYKVYNYIEGSLIKVYYHEGNWNLSTSRNINASKSFWRTKKSFQEMFLEVFSSKDFEELDKEKCYTFILHNKFTSEYKKFDNYKFYLLLFTYDRRTNVSEINSKLEVSEKIHNLEKTSNYIIYSNGNYIKHLNKEYVSYKKLMSYHRDCGMCYLNVIFDENYKKILYRSSSKEKKKIFSLIERLYNRSIKKIMFLYPYYKEEGNRKHISIDYPCYTKTLDKLVKINKNKFMSRKFISVYMSKLDTKILRSIIRYTY